MLIFHESFSGNGSSPAARRSPEPGALEYKLMLTSGIHSGLPKIVVMIALERSIRSISGLAAAEYKLELWNGLSIVRRCATGM